MATRAELSELLLVLEELRTAHFADSPHDLVRSIAEVESRNLENHRVALTELRRLIDAEVAKHQ